MAWINTAAEAVRASRSVNPDPRRNPPVRRSRLVSFLGWFSLGLGVGELVATERLTKTLGMTGSETLVRAYGVREITAGLMTFAAPTAGIVGRLAGDALDLATLSAENKPGNRQQNNLMIAIAAVAGVTLLDAIALVMPKTS